MPLLIPACALVGLVRLVENVRDKLVFGVLGKLLVGLLHDGALDVEVGEDFVLVLDLDTPVALTVDDHEVRAGLDLLVLHRLAHARLARGDHRGVRDGEHRPLALELAGVVVAVRDAAEDRALAEAAPKVADTVPGLRARVVQLAVGPDLRNWSIRHFTFSLHARTEERAADPPLRGLLDAPLLVGVQ